MANNENGRTANRREGGEAGTLLPMLIGGLVLITVGMTAVAILV